MLRSPFAARRVPCGTRSCGPLQNSLHSLRSLRSDTCSESVHEARGYARGHKPSVPRRRRNRPVCAPLGGLLAMELVREPLLTQYPSF
jgi:hypothetical protein